MKSISRGTKFPRGTPRKLGGHSWDARQQDCQVLLATARQQDYHVHQQLKGKAAARQQDCHLPQANARQQYCPVLLVTARQQYCPVLLVTARQQYCPVLLVTARQQDCPVLLVTARQQDCPVLLVPVTARQQAMWPAMTQHHLLLIFYIAQSTAFFIVIVKLENIGENWRVSLCFTVVLFMLLIKILSKVTHLVGR